LETRWLRHGRIFSLGSLAFRPLRDSTRRRFPVKIAGEVRDFQLDAYIGTKEARTMDSFIHYGIAAAVQAVADAGLPTGDALGEEAATRALVV
jgi:3-oxoacyl-[acyl-carrier-protein] synthase II